MDFFIIMWCHIFNKTRPQQKSWHFAKNVSFWQNICILIKISLNFVPEHLTHWGWVMHICIGNLTIIGSDNGLLSGRCQAIIWTNAGIWLTGPLRTKSNGILVQIKPFSFKKMHVKVSSVKWLPFCLSLNVWNDNKSALDQPMVWCHTDKKPLPESVLIHNT